MSPYDSSEQNNAEDALHSHETAIPGFGVVEKCGVITDQKSESLSIEAVEQDGNVATQAAALLFRWRLDLTPLQGTMLVTIGSEHRIRWTPSRDKTTIGLYPQTVTLQLDSKVFPVYLLLLISSLHSTTIICRSTIAFSLIMVRRSGLKHLYPYAQHSLSHFNCLRHRPRLASALKKPTVLRPHPAVPLIVENMFSHL